MRAIVPALIIGSLTFAVIIYLNATTDLFSFISQPQPQIASADGTTPVRSRSKRIDALLISATNKDDLRAGRPFWGAAQHMVELAFNTKASSAIVNKQDQFFYEFQTYQFGGNRGTVIFEFRDNKLICIHTPTNQQSNCQPNQQSYYGSNVPFSQLTQ